MKAIRIHETGGPETLRYEDVPDPTPGRGEALVRVGAAGVNFIDIYFRTGLYPYVIPGTLGLEAAGPGLRDDETEDKIRVLGRIEGCLRKTGDTGSELQNVLCCDYTATDLRSNTEAEGPEGGLPG